jgi:hypothetical protein
MKKYTLTVEEMEAVEALIAKHMARTDCEAHLDLSESHDLLDTLQGKLQRLLFVPKPKAVQP